jgi:hypothetical protein
VQVRYSFTAVCQRFRAARNALGPARAADTYASSGQEQ